MAHDAAAIVQEYTHVKDSTVRENAVKALSQLGTGDSIAGLLHVALNDEDEAIRLAAEKQLCTLTGGTATMLDRAIQKLLQNRATARNAYLLLGRLRARGAPFRLRGCSILRRLLLARDAGLRPERRVQWIAAKAALVGGMLGVLMFWVYLLGYLGFSGEAFALAGPLLGYLLLTTAVSSPLLAFLAARRTYVRALRTDRFAAVVVGLGRAIVVALLGIVLVVLIWLLLFRWAGESIFGFEMSGQPSVYRSAAAAAVVVLSWLLSVRLGTLASLGVSSSPRPARWWQTASGVASGLLVLTTVTLVIHALDHSGLALGPGQTSLALWVFAAPCTFGLADSFVYLDTQVLYGPASPPRSLAPPLSRHLVRGLVTVVALAISIPVIRRATEAREARLDQTSAPVINAGTRSHEWRISSLPQTRVFVVGSLRDSAEVSAARHLGGKWQSSTDNASRHRVLLERPSMDQLGFDLCFELWQLRTPQSNERRPEQGPATTTAGTADPTPPRDSLIIAVGTLQKIAKTLEPGKYKWNLTTSVWDRSPGLEVTYVLPWLLGQYHVTVALDEETAGETDQSRECRAAAQSN